MPNSKDDLLRARPWQIVVLLLTGMVAGALLGGLINAISFWVDHIGYTPVSMIEVDRVASVRIVSIRRGLFLGWLIGTCLSLVLVAALSLISKLRCPLRLGISVQIRILMFSLLFWIAGGLNAVLLVYLNPNYFGNLVEPVFYGLVTYPQGATPGILRTAWISGSTWGIYLGSVISTIGCLFSFAAKWRQLEKQAQS